MDCNDLTEDDVINHLLDISRVNGEVSPRCVIVNRLQPINSITRVVKFALIVTSNNTTLIDALIKSCLELDWDLFFKGSEVNLQSDLEIDYLYFEASINAKI
jgi:hypothetical protein